MGGFTAHCESPDVTLTHCGGISFSVNSPPMKEGARKSSTSSLSLTAGFLVCWGASEVCGQGSRSATRGGRDKRDVFSSLSISLFPFITLSLPPSLSLSFPPSRPTPQVARCIPASRRQCPSRRRPPWRRTPREVQSQLRLATTGSALRVFAPPARAPRLRIPSLWGSAALVAFYFGKSEQNNYASRLRGPCHA